MDDLPIASLDQLLGTARRPVAETPAGLAPQVALLHPIGQQGARAMVVGQVA